MRVVYFLLTHQPSPQIPRLIERLRGGGDALVLLHHDAGAAPLRLPRHDDVHILVDPVEVRWGELSQVEATLRGIDWLRQEGITFDWLLTLSGQDALAQPLSRTEANLAGAEVDGFVSHLPISASRLRNPTPWQQMCWRRYFRRRVRWLGREFSIPRRHPYDAKVGCFAGSSWLNLSRAAVEAIWTADPLRTTLLAHLEAVPSPDESFFQTLLCANSSLRLEHDSKRFVRWQPNASHPDCLLREDIPAILASGAFFARKFDEVTNPGVLADVEDALASADAVPGPGPGKR